MPDQDTDYFPFGLIQGPDAEALISHLRNYSMLVTVPSVLQASIITNFFYYCALHFDEEFNYIWSRPWTCGKVIYIATRYAGAIFLILIGVGLLPIRWNDVGYPLPVGRQVELQEVGTCFGGYLYVIAVTVVTFLADIILAMRIYALYGKRKWVIVLSSVLILISCAGTQSFGMIYFVKTLDCIERPCLYDSPIPFHVTATCSMMSYGITLLGWIPTTINELVFVALVLWKTRKAQTIRGEFNLARSCGKPHAVDIMGVMARDSKRYFLQIFVLCFTGLCLGILAVLETVRIRSSSLAILLPTVLQNTFATFSVAALSILAPELFISLRMEYYGPVGTLVERSQLTWAVAAPEGRSEDAPQESGSSPQGCNVMTSDRDTQSSKREHV